MKDLHIYYKGGEKFGCGYIYGVTIGASPMTAFRTHQAFIGWLALHEIALTVSGEQWRVNEATGKRELSFLLWAANKTIKEGASFFSLDQIPIGAIPYIGLSNGKYTTCYLARGEALNTVYKPNPNACKLTVCKAFDHREAEDLIAAGVYSVAFLTK